MDTFDLHIASQKSITKVSYFTAGLIILVIGLLILSVYLINRALSEKKKESDKTPSISVKGAIPN